MTMKRAYVTTISGGDAYVPGVEALGRSLAASGTNVPRVALVTAEVTLGARHRLEAQGWSLHEIEPLASPNPEAVLIFPRFAQTFTKLRAFGLAEFDKIVLLDADTIVLRNVEELFERPSFSAAPDFFLPDRFNSGVMVIEPSPALFATLEQALHGSHSYDGGDQGFLNEFFPTWYEGAPAHRLRSGYNLHHFVFQFLLGRKALRQHVLDEVRIIHFTLQKPWQSVTLSGGADLWWNFYFSAHPEKANPWHRRIHQLEDWTFDSVVRALGG